MTYSIAVNIDGPRNPQYLLELAEGFAGIARAMNHLTRDHAALEYPSEADTLIRSLESAASRLPQLLDQVAGWVEIEAGRGQIRVAAGDWEGVPAMAVAAVRLRADRARAAAEELQDALQSLAAATNDLGAVEGGEDGGA